ncbi:MAG: hypothetical protein K2F81_08945 [Ruminococcus sp.]|nr:hypothetical protein [Ruminococcus sp.]
MEIILLNGKIIEINSKEVLFKHFNNCRYPYSDAVNAFGEGLIDNNEFYVLMKQAMKGDSQ